MSYATRMYRHRNAHSNDKENQTESAFFPTQTPFFQPKLTVNQPGDKYEKEADTIANAVVNKNEKPASVQRLSTSEEEEKTGTNDSRMKEDKDIQEKPEVQRKCAECEKEEKKDEGAVQKKSDCVGSASTPGLASRIGQSAGKGAHLPKGTNSFFRTAFGHDFSKVTIHTDEEAVNMNRQLGAQAFTHGSDIYFNRGKFAPGTKSGKELLAHELTHVLQQKGEEATPALQRDVDPAAQPGGPLDFNDQLYTFQVNEDGKLEGCGPIPNAAGGSQNACVSGDSKEQILNWFKRKQPSGGNVNKPKNCPEDRWNFILNTCCPEGTHIDKDKHKCLPNVKEEELEIPPAPEPPEKGDFNVPEGDTSVA
jgi:hypothetical protein